jgi:hypothetical protein
VRSCGQITPPTARIIPPHSFKCTLNSPKVSSEEQKSKRRKLKHVHTYTKSKENKLWLLVRERTIPTERPPPLDEL